MFENALKPLGPTGRILLDGCPTSYILSTKKLQKECQEQGVNYFFDLDSKLAL